MIDVSNSLFSALPPSFRNNGVPTSVALNKPVPSEAGANSLRRVASNFKPDTRVGDFSPPAEGQQGFASLSTALESVRLPPAALNPGSQSDYVPSWERLLEEQNLIADARVERQERFDEILQEREDEAARRAANEERAREVRANIVLDQANREPPPEPPRAEDNIPPFSTRQIDPQPEQPAVTGSGPVSGENETENAPAVELSLPGDGERIAEQEIAGAQVQQPQTEPAPEPELQTFPPGQDQPGDNTQVYRADQERLQRLFFPDGGGGYAARPSESFSSYA